MCLVHLSLSALVSPVSSPPASRRLEKELSFARSRHDSFKSSGSSQTQYSIEELEMLLEAYFELKEYIDDTEDFSNIQLNVAEHTEMPSTAVPPPPLPPPTYEVSTSPNLSLEPHTSGSAVGVENSDDTLNRIARGMFGGLC